MFNIFKKKNKALFNNKNLKANTNENVIFKDLLGQQLQITREISGNEVLFGLGIDKNKAILDKELCFLLISILKEYCLTNDILNSFEMLREKED